MAERLNAFSLERCANCHEYAAWRLADGTAVCLAHLPDDDKPE